MNLEQEVTIRAPFELETIRMAVSIGVLMLLIFWESAAPFFDFFRARWRERMIHGVRNLIVGGLNLLTISLVFSLAWTAAAAWAEQNHFGISNWMGLSLWPHLLLAILLMDFWTYWWHWLNHRVPFFWRFHRMHHSDPRMDVTTANRFHLGEICISSFLRIFLIALFGVRLWELIFYEICLYAVVQFHHANIGLPKSVDLWLRWLIPTPAMHKVHHSRLLEEANSNYSSLFSIWDRMFGTFRSHPAPEKIQFGLTDFDHPRDQTLRGLIETPFSRQDAETQRGRE